LCQYFGFDAAVGEPLPFSDDAFLLLKEVFAGLALLVVPYYDRQHRTGAE
jgi:hypothetical protein